MYKLVSSIINSRISAKVKLDDAIHSFRALRGTSTAIMEAKLLVQLCSQSDIPFFMVFLDLKKAYDMLDRFWAMEVLKEYSVGNNLCRIIESQGDMMVPRQGGYYGRPLQA